MPYMLSNHIYSKFLNKINVKNHCILYWGKVNTVWPVSLIKRAELEYKFAAEAEGRSMRRSATRPMFAASGVSRPASYPPHPQSGKFPYPIVSGHMSLLTHKQCI